MPGKGGSEAEGERAMSLPIPAEEKRDSGDLVSSNDWIEAQEQWESGICDLIEAGRLMDDLPLQVMAVGWAPTKSKN